MKRVVDWIRMEREDVEEYEEEEESRGRKRVISGHDEREDHTL